MAILPDNEYTEIEDRTYVNPEVSRNEQQTFIDNYRNLVNDNNTQTATETANLGTQTTSNLGGLGSSVSPQSYFTSRYSTPQTNQTVAQLRQTMDEKALSDALERNLAIKQKQYQDAYSSYQKAATAASTGSNTGSNTTGGTTPEGDVADDPTEEATTVTDDIVDVYNNSSYASPIDRVVLDGQQTELVKQQLTNSKPVYVTDSDGNTWHATYGYTANDNSNPIGAVSSWIQSGEWGKKGTYYLNSLVNDDGVVLTGSDATNKATQMGLASKISI